METATTDFVGWCTAVILVFVFVMEFLVVKHTEDTKNEILEELRKPIPPSAEKGDGDGR
jgi:hypothetical protein